MQAKLQPAEFAYLLHSLGAKQVVGVDNAQLFPADDSTRDELLRRGLKQLLAHGWFVADGDQVSSNPGLMLLAAAIAAPNATLSATHFPRKDARQIITYYLTDGLIVEQFLTAGGDYQLAQLASPAALVLRLAKIFSLPEEAEPRIESLSFDPAAFEGALSLARKGNLSSLRQIIGVNPVAADKVGDLAGVIATLQPAGKIEVASLAGTRLLSRQELGLLHTGSGQPWLAAQNLTGRALVLTPADPHRFETLLQYLLENTTYQHQTD